MGFFEIYARLGRICLERSTRVVTLRLFCCGACASSLRVSDEATCRVRGPTKLPTTAPEVAGSSKFPRPLFFVEVFVRTFVGMRGE